MTQITTHILDTSKGAPAAQVLITLMRQQEDDWLLLGTGETNTDGRVADFTGDSEALQAGVYKLSFFVENYFKSTEQSCFYPHVEVVFEIGGDGQHYHVPLLLNPYGYSTYRGS